MTQAVIEDSLLSSEDSAYQERLKQMEAEHQARKERIAQLASNEHLTAEIDVVERSRILQQDYETERHKQAKDRINADCDRLRDEIIARYLNKSEQAQPSNDETITDILES